MSLNDALYKSYDRLVSVMFILYTFPEKRVAICSDIREMYHRAKIRSENQHAQRLLWPQEELKGPVDVPCYQ